MIFDYFSFLLNIISAPLYKNYKIIPLVHNPRDTETLTKPTLPPYSVYDSEILCV